MVEDGNLILEAGQGKNITFRTEGDGTLNFFGGSDGGASVRGGDFIDGVGGGGTRRQREVQQRIER